MISSILTGYWKRYEKEKRQTMIAGYPQEARDFFMHMNIVKTKVIHRKKAGYKEYQIFISSKNNNMTLVQRRFEEGAYTSWTILGTGGEKHTFQDTFGLTDQQAMDLQKMFLEFPFDEHIS